MDVNIKKYYKLYRIHLLAIFMDITSSCDKCDLNNIHCLGRLAFNHPSKLMFVGNCSLLLLSHYYRAESASQLA